jgi:hypothetical protein
MAHGIESSTFALCGFRMRSQHLTQAHNAGQVQLVVRTALSDSEWLSHWPWHTSTSIFPFWRTKDLSAGSWLTNNDIFWNYLIVNCTLDLIFWEHLWLCFMSEAWGKKKENSLCREKTRFTFLLSTHLLLVQHGCSLWWTFASLGWISKIIHRTSGFPKADASSLQAD